MTSICVSALIATNTRGAVVQVPVFVLSCERNSESFLWVLSLDSAE